MEESRVQELEKAIVDMAVEAWRFRSVFERAMSKLDAGEGSKYINKYQWFMRRVNAGLETAGMKIVNLEGQPYDIGMALSPLNIEDFEPDEALFVEQMIEPVIMGKEGLVRAGTALLGRYAE